jgi:hypothetical protein
MMPPIWTLLYYFGRLGLTQRFISLLYDQGCHSAEGSRVHAANEGNELDYLSRYSIASVGAVVLGGG